ncbi:MAG TPA: hypothetical protein VF589_10535 [Allosphingosinicella sp.]|jgi:hypothetical protein
MKFAPHPGATRRFGPPADWDPELHGPCGTLEVADIVRDTPDGGQLFMESLWRPEPEDLAALNAGAAIVLGIRGCTHPVVYVGVTSAPKHDGGGGR